MVINFLLICEGASDAGLIPHLIDLCTLHGAENANGVVPDWSKVPVKAHSLHEKISPALKAAPETELLFIHRDADGRDPTPRYEEIEEAIGPHPLTPSPNMYEGEFLDQNLQFFIGFK